MENKLAILNEYETTNSSPGVRRAALMKSHMTEFNAKNYPKQYADKSTNGYANTEKCNDNYSTYSSIADSNTLKKYKFLGIDPGNVTPIYDSLPSKDVMSKSYHESFLNKTEEKETNIMSTSLINFDTNGHHNQNGPKQFANFSSNDYAKSKSTTLLSNKKNDDGIEKLNGLVLELNEIVRESEKAKERNSNGKTNKFILPLDETPFRKESKFILPLEEIDIALRRQRFSMKKCELKRLQSEQSRLMDAINNVKTKLLDIQQQKDEIIREVGIIFFKN